MPLNGKQIQDDSIKLAKIDPSTGQTLVLTGTSKITEEAVPVNPHDLTNKAYVDSLVQPGGNIYNGESPTNVTVGGLVANSNILGLSITDILQTILVTYLSPTFTSFYINGQASILEVGATILGSKTFDWGTSNNSNINANTIKITDLTHNVVIVSNLSNTGSTIQTINSIQNNTANSNTWKIEATNTNNITFITTYSIYWEYRMYYGNNNNTQLSSADITTLTNNLLTSNIHTTYSFLTTGYKYFVFPDAITNITAITGFKDTSTNLVVAMVSNIEDSSYSNVQDGWYYMLVPVTNGFGTIVNYRVYRTKNMLSGAINIAVS